MTTLVKSRRNVNLRKLTAAAMLAALATVLMYFEFSVPIMPFFVKLDFSEAPGLIAAFILGPVYGVGVCAVKNIVHLYVTTTGGIGELCNFLIGAMMVLPAGFIHYKKPNYKGAVIGALVGAVSMAIISVPVNYFISYPVYNVLMPMEEIIALYKAINPSIDNLFQAILTFNMPFTLLKGLLCFGITSMLYLPLMPALRKNHFFDK